VGIASSYLHPISIGTDLRPASDGGSSNCAQAELAVVIFAGNPQCAIGVNAQGVPAARRKRAPQRLRPQR